MDGHPEYHALDGIHFNVRLDENRLCALVVVGVRTDGTKELVSISDGIRESTESWADVLRDVRRRGMAAPTVAVGDGALGFWAALRDVFPETVEARCWVHKAANVLNALPKSAQPAARRALAEIRDAEDRDHALAAIRSFEADYGAKWPKAVAKIVDDTDVLLSFFDYPAEHWIHLKTTNPIESPPPPRRFGPSRRPLRGRRARRTPRRRRPRPVGPRPPGRGVNPVRDDTATICPTCRSPFEKLGRQRFCSTGCRQAAWRAGRAAPTQPVVAKPDTVYACPDCDARYLGEQRCDDCNTWCRLKSPCSGSSLIAVPPHRAVLPARPRLLVLSGRPLPPEETS